MFLLPCPSSSIFQEMGLVTWKALRQISFTTHNTPSRSKMTNRRFFPRHLFLFRSIFQKRCTQNKFSRALFSILGSLTSSHYGSFFVCCEMLSKTFCTSCKVNDSKWVYFCSKPYFEGALSDELHVVEADYLGLFWFLETSKVETLNKLFVIYFHLQCETHILYRNSIGRTKNTS